VSLSLSLVSPRGSGTSSTTRTTKKNKKNNKKKEKEMKNKTLASIRGPVGTPGYLVAAKKKMGRGWNEKK
jgi:ribosomal protein L13E